MKKNRLNEQSLTENEKKCLEMYANDLTVNQIADKLILSPKTIGRHLDNAKYKLGLERRTSLIVYYHNFLSNENTDG